MTSRVEGHGASVARTAARLAPPQIAAAIAGVAVLAALGAFLFSRLVDAGVTYDEGVYLLSLDALRHGQDLGTQVFSPQPPGFYVLLQVIASVGGVTVSAVRWGMVGCAVATVFGVGLLGRALAGNTAGALAASLLVIAPPFTSLAASIYADLPAMTFAVLALALVADPRARPRTVVVSGALLGAAISVKLTGLVVAPAYVALLLLAPGRRRRTLQAGLGFIVLLGAFAIVYLHSLGAIWNDAVSYHESARRTPDVMSNTAALRGFFDLGTPFFWFVCAGVAAGLVFVRGRTLAVWLFPVTAAAFILWHHPLHENHLLVLPVSFAAAAGTSLGVAVARLPRRAFAVAMAAVGLVWAAGYVQQDHRVNAAFAPEERALVEAASILDRVTRPGDYVVSDQPAVPFLARRQVPGPLVDTAVLRFATDSLTNPIVLRTIDQWHVRTVVAGRSFLLRPGLLRALHGRFGRLEKVGPLEIFSKRVAP
jgi:4-amino-4-deoxy-L-arabinose transferase-like glycosyltransferase